MGSCPSKTPNEGVDGVNKPTPVGSTESFNGGAAGSSPKSEIIDVVPSASPCQAAAVQETPDNSAAGKMEQVVIASQNN